MKRIEVNVMTGEVTVVVLTAEEIVALPPPAPPHVPTITRRQLRLALLRLGVTGDQVEAKIAAMPGTPIEREAAMIEWRDSGTYERDHQLVVALGAALGLTEAQIDAAWMEAATI
ncbi:MAG: hypothetical protein LW713_12865 [Acetobacteraceae bacterium]|nr:hypothetical protein [Acetobacteraceae bacterium]